MAQSELFEHLETSPSAPKRRQDKPVFATQRLSYSVTYQQAALAGAGLLMAFVAAFALGVERGKHASLIVQTRVRAVPVHPVPPTGAMTPSVSAPTTRLAAVTPALVVTPAAVTPAANRAAAVTSAASSATRQYTIQVGTYDDRQEAEWALAKLTRAGYSAYLSEGHQRVVLCVGSFPTRETAAKQLAALRKKFHDCFVRVR